MVNSPEQFGRDDLVVLNSKTEGDKRKYYFYLTEEAQRAEIPANSYVGVQLDSEFDIPTLIIGYVGQDDPDLTIPLVRKLDKQYRVFIPPQFLECRDTESEGSLCLDTINYKPNNRLLFRPLIAKEILGLQPVVWENGVKYNSPKSNKT